MTLDQHCLSLLCVALVPSFPRNITCIYTPYIRPLCKCCRAQTQSGACTITSVDWLHVQLTHRWGWCLLWTFDILWVIKVKFAPYERIKQDLTFTSCLRSSSLLGLHLQSCCHKGNCRRSEELTFRSAEQLLSCKMYFLFLQLGNNGPVIFRSLDEGWCIEIHSQSHCLIIILVECFVCLCYVEILHYALSKGLII